MRKIITYIILSMLVAFTTILSAQIDQIDNLDEHIEKGKVRLKLKQEVFQQSTSLKSLNVANASETSIGVSSIDRIGEQLGITRIKRVFPFSLKNETKHRKYGLHLWLEIEFDNNVDVEYAVELYKQSTEVDIAKPLFKKIRLDGDQKPVKYKAGKLQSVKSALVNESTLKAASEELPEPDDPMFGDQWHYETDLDKYENGLDIELLKGWTIASGDTGVIVAIVDGGIDVEHEDLAKNIWINNAELNGEEWIDDDQNGYVDDIHGFNFVFPGDITPHDHGTHVAGTVGAITNNGIGVAGVAGGGVTYTNEDGDKYSEDGVRMISCQVFDNRSSTSGNFAAAIVYGADNGAVISQNSWGYTVPNYYEPEVYDAVKYFIAEAGQYEGSPMKGGILFFAAGNDGLEQTHYPATFEEVVAVTSIGPEGWPAAYTNYGEWTDIAAPGGDQMYYEHEGGVLSTLPQNDYGYFQGTSMACPHVSGVAALVLTKFGGDEMTPEDLRNRIENSTKRFIFDHQGKYGTGMLNAPNALANDEKIPPEVIDDLEAKEIYHDEVRLGWTIPVDEDNFQPAIIYLTLSGSEITADNFDLKPQLVFENPFDAGTEVQVDIGGLIKQTDYWFAIKSEDQFGNISEISNIVSLTTTDSPQFGLSKNTINVNIDVAAGTTYSEIIQVSNVGEGLIYWENYVENERKYFEEKKEEEEDPVVEATTALKEKVDAKLAFAEENPGLFSVDVNPQTQALTLKSGGVATKLYDYWDYDETIFKAGMSYENGKDPASLLSTYNRNAGLIQATRFNVDYDYTFNLTHLEVAMYNNTVDAPILIELRKGSTKLEDAEVVYMQEYFSDTTEVFGFQRIPLYKPHRFEDGEVFWVVLHFPKEDVQPLGLAMDTYHPNIFLMSRDNGRSFFDLQPWRDGPFIPLVRALSTGDDGSYVFLKPGQGEVEGGDSQDVEVFIDATNLSEGNHLASVTLITNDADKTYVPIEVNVNVTGQESAIDTSKIHTFNVLQNMEHELELSLKNTGLSVLEVYDIASDESGFEMNFVDDTVFIYVDYTSEVPIKYTPSHVGVFQTKVNLITNHGVIGIPVSMNSTEPAGMNAAFTSGNVINLAYGESGTINLDITNDVTGSDLEYDLTHYNMLDAAKGIMPNMMTYKVISSNDVGGPLAGAWDDISEVGTTYDMAYSHDDTLKLGAKIPFFNEVMETAYHGFEGVIYFYETWEDGVQLPAEFPEKIGLGAMAPLLFSDSSAYFPIKEFIHHSYGDKNVFTVTVKERISGNPNADSDELTYQVVLYRDGTVEYRYKDVSAITSEMEYVVALHGFTTDDYVVYKNLDEDNPVTNGLVIRFEPQFDASMILQASPNKGLLSDGDTESLSLSIEPSLYDVYAGSYSNSVIVNANTANGGDELPFTINITGAESFKTEDTIRFELTNIGHTATQLLKVENNGSDKGTITSITFSDAAFECNVSLPYEINPMAHRHLPLDYSPSAVGAINATMTLVYSNGVSEMVRLESEGQIDPAYTHTIPTDIKVNVNAGEMVTVPFSVTTLSTGANLDYNFVNGVNAYASHETIANASEDNAVKQDGLFGYTWQTDTLQILHKWDTIEDDAEVLNIKQGKQYALELPFEFPFYGEMQDSIWISKNGYVTVVEPSGDEFDLDFVEDDGLAGMIAPFWALLDFNEDGEGVWLKTETDRVVVEWNNMKPTIVDGGYSNGGNVTFQLEILSDGRIYFHYKSLLYYEGLLQYGLESPDESEHLNKPRTWILDWTDLYDNRTIAIAPPLKSTIKAGQTSDFKVEVDGNRFFKSGSYRDTVRLLTDSYSQPEMVIPVDINFAGEAELMTIEIPTFEEVIYSEGLVLTGWFELANRGSDIMEINQLEDADLGNVKFYDAEGEELIRSIVDGSTLLRPIEINPWQATKVQIEIPVTEFSDFAGTIKWNGNFAEVISDISVTLVESPEFAWDASDQTFNLNATEDGSYSFALENKGETTLKYELVPTVIPPDDGSGSPVIDEVGNYSFELSSVVDSIAIDTKDVADGVFTPLIQSNLSFCNQFVAPEGGFFITHVKAWTYLKQLDQYVNVMIYVGGDDPQDPDKEIREFAPQSGTKVYDQNYVIDQQTDGQWVTYPLAKPVVIPEGETFYVMVSPPVDRSYVGYDLITDQQVQERSFTGVYWTDGDYKWYSSANEDWNNQINKIRPLTAAGKGQWIELDYYSGELSGGENVTVTATFDAKLAGSGEHQAKLIVQSNDINNPSDLVNIYLNVNGAPKVIYHPNTDMDTVKVIEWDELIVNMMASDPEGEKLTFNLVEDNNNPEVEFEQVSDHSIQMKLRTDYNGQGVYTYFININDEAGNETRDSILVEVVDKNRTPYLNPEYEIIYLNMADPTDGFTIDANKLFIDEDGDELNILAGNYTPDIVDLALGYRYITINPLQQGTGFLAFAADDGKENGFAVYGVYVVIINDPDAVDGSPDGFGGNVDFEEGELLKVVPNPVVNDIAKVWYNMESEGSVQIDVYDIVGKKSTMVMIGDRTEGVYNEQIDVSSLDRGIYFCKLIVDGKFKSTVKMMIN